jgi:hypothetical protein
MDENKLSNAQKLKAELDAARVEFADAQRRGEFQRAGELGYGRIPDLEKKLAMIEASTGALRGRLENFNLDLEGTRKTIEIATDWLCAVRDTCDARSLDIKDVAFALRLPTRAPHAQVRRVTPENLHSASTRLSGIGR